MVASQARRPVLNSDIRKLLQQADRLFQVLLFLIIKLLLTFCKHGHCHDEGIWFCHGKVCRPSLVKVI
jgi:hypothetical protein